MKKKNIDINELKRLYNSNFTILQIAKYFNCSTSVISINLKRNNITLHKKNEKEVDEKKLYTMYVNDKKIKEIADHFGCSVSTIRKKINDYNFKLRLQKVYFKPYVGQKFNRLKFLKEDKVVNNKKRWLCECECGEIKSFDYYAIIKGTTKSCGCYHHDNVKEYNWTGYQEIPGRYWGSIVRGAKKRNIKFEISFEYAWKIYELQNKKCALSNVNIFFKTKNNFNIEHEASLDRIDNNKGYVEGNVQWIAKQVNYMKNRISEDKFIYFCKTINKYQNND